MKTKLLIFTCICLLLIGSLVACKKEQKSYENEQQKWAQKYGVKIEDYSYPDVFPVYYFVDKLKKGDSIEVVHNLIQGYEKVYHCRDYAEIYYYFGSDSATALRFAVLYDDNIRYKDITVEDKNSNNLDTFGCVAEGPITVK